MVKPTDIHPKQTSSRVKKDQNLHQKFQYKKADHKGPETHTHKLTHKMNSLTCIV